MIKFIVAAVWLCAVTLGGVLYSFQTSQARQGEAPPPPLFGGQEYVHMEVMSVPVVGDGRVSGYFLTRLAYLADPEEMGKLTVPARLLFVDGLYGYLFANPKIDWSDKKAIDLPAFKAGIRDAINKKVGADLIKDVMIEQVDYLSKDEIRNNALRRRLGPEAEPATPAPKGEKSGHGGGH